jgi:hypothetical protein
MLQQRHLVFFDAWAMLLRAEESLFGSRSKNIRLGINNLRKFHEAVFKSVT